MKDRVKISKKMSYLLRHAPSGLDISEEGFVNLENLLTKLKRRWSKLKESDVREIVEKDPKGRYEIEGDKVRALYGHSIEVDPTLNGAKVDKLYHGTTQKAAKKILEEGLKPKGRQKVHLSKTLEDAIEVGKRRTNNPTILEVDVETAQAEGIETNRASERIYVASSIPARFISVSPQGGNTLERSSKY